MDKRTHGRRAIETGKYILIVLLTCSALWLVSRTQMAGPLRSLFQEETPQADTSQAQTEERVSAARPLRITASLPGGGRCGAQYDESARDALFQQVAPLLVETMSSAAAPETITRGQWEEALTKQTGVCLDFQGEVPLAVLSGWLSGEPGRLTATVRRLALSVWEGTAALYYRDERDGGYYRCRSEVVDASRLESALTKLADNGTFYAFESELYDALDPDTLLRAELPAMTVYTASSPVTGDQETLEALAEDLDFSINPNGIYYAGEWVARSGNDTLRLSERGVVSYLAEAGGGDHFLVSGQDGSGGLFDAVERCRQLASATLGTRCGQARLYLMSVTETEQGWEIEFGYSLNGIPVRLETGFAARFLVEDGQITQFFLHFRSYTDSGETSAVLPVRQAAAALEAMGLEGEELLLVYTDGGGDALSAGWAAADRGPGKG